MILPASATVAVIDGERLLMFRNTGRGAPRLAPQPVPAIRPGGAASEGHRSSAANPDNDTQAEDDFLAAVAERLNRAATAGDFEDLLVIAPPRALGELRKHWSKGLKARLIGEINHDLTMRSPEEIAEAINQA